VSTTRPPSPRLSLRKDTNIPDDRITANPRIDVLDLVTGARWEYSLNYGRTWTRGSKSSFVVPDGTYGFGQVQARQQNRAGLWSDRLLGTAGRDIFDLGAMGASSIGRLDRIIGYQGQDRIRLSGVQYKTTLRRSAGNLSALNTSTVENLLKGRLPAGAAAAFTVNGWKGTFVALNDRSAGFSSAADSLVFLAGYTLGSSAPVVLA